MILNSNPKEISYKMAVLQFRPDMTAAAAGAEPEEMHDKLLAYPPTSHLFMIYPHIASSTSHPAPLPTDEIPKSSS